MSSRGSTSPFGLLVASLAVSLVLLAGCAGSDRAATNADARPSTTTGMGNMDGMAGMHGTTTTRATGTPTTAATHLVASPTEAQAARSFPPVPTPTAARTVAPGCKGDPMASMDMDGTPNEPFRAGRARDGSYERTFVGMNARVETSKVPFDTPPTAAQRRDATAFVAQVRAAVAAHGWTDPAQAVRDGYRPMQACNSHYVNIAYALDGRVLDPDRPEYLVIAAQPNGSTRLEAVMFMADDLGHGPQRFGTLAPWHYHHQGTCLLGPAMVPEQGTGCPTGSRVLDRTPEMLHVSATGPPFSGGM